MDLESNTSDNLRELNETFFVNYMALAEHSKSLIANYFTNVRELESNLHASMQVIALLTGAWDADGGRLRSGAAASRASSNRRPKRRLPRGMSAGAGG